MSKTLFGNAYVKNCISLKISFFEKGLLNIVKLRIIILDINKLQNKNDGNSNYKIKKYLLHKIFN